MRQLLVALCSLCRLLPNASVADVSLARQAACRSISHKRSASGKPSATSAATAAQGQRTLCNVYVLGTTSTHECVERLSHLCASNRDAFKSCVDIVLCLPSCLYERAFSQYLDLDNCKQCFRVWRRHFSYLSQEEAQQKLKSDPKFSPLWSMASDADDNSSTVPTFGEGVVGSEEKYRNVFRKSYIIFKLSEFKERYGCAPSALKIKPTLIPDEGGKQRSVYLVINPRKPDEELDVERIVDVSKQESSFTGKEVYEHELDMFFWR